MVEHNLAKVGVASSNLVSRSIILLFLLLTSVLSSEIYIEKNYCIEQDTLYASFFGYKGKENFTVVHIPKERNHYAVASSSLISPFVDRNISIVDSSEGVVIFKRHCALMGKHEEILSAFLKKFQEDSPFVKIEGKPAISIKSTLPQDFGRYKLVAVTIPEAMLKKNSGSFIATFKVGDKEKKITFYYTLSATVEVFKAKRNLLNGKILVGEDYERVSVSLDALPARAILHQMTSAMMIKSHVKEGQILTDNLFEMKKDVDKKETIKAFLKEGGLVIEVQATLLEDANIGQVVKIKTEQGKILSAKIISYKEAVIVE